VELQSPVIIFFASSNIRISNKIINNEIDPYTKLSKHEETRGSKNPKCDPF
jgi:hypothetical protein